MLKSKLKKVFFIIASIVLSTSSNASTIRDYFVTGETRSLEKIGDLKNTLYGTLTWIGWALAIFVTLIVGIQFLTATPQKRAQLKEKLWLIILGVAILAGGIPVLQLIANLIEEFAKSL